LPTEDFHKRDTKPVGNIPEQYEELPEPPTPEKIGPYTIERLIDKGGMSYLYLSQDPATHIPLVIKVLSPRFVKNREVTERFLNEAKIIGLADHPNIVKLFGSGEWEGGLFIAMEYIEGISLRKWLDQSVPSLKKGVELILEIAYALVHLHTHHVIHRDLKPENIIVTQDNHIKVIDFGIAQVLNDRAIDSMNKRFIGTPIYISPEQRDDPQKVSYPSDIYSLGIVAYEILLGKISQGNVYLNLMPKGVRGILSKALSKKPQDRYHDVVDFIGDLSLYLHSQEIEKDKTNQDPISESYREVLDLAKTSLQPSNDQIDYCLTPHISYPTLMWFYENNRFILIEDAEQNKTSFLKYLQILGWIKQNKDAPLKEFIKNLNLYLYNNFSSPFAGAIFEKNSETISGAVFADTKALINDEEIKAETALGVTNDSINLIKIKSENRILIHSLKEILYPQNDLSSMLSAAKLKDPAFIEKRLPYLFSVFKST
jgi:serine/threonine protein kinase